ncbi:hypothetical protein [Ornithinimicrobium sp. Y1694]|uniref:hypothetical protein n=1 Tax=Ornithinimicrobium sp. Y1694 TaxID=3418590 RepID=UPI003CEC2919
MSDLSHLDALTTRPSSIVVLARDLRRRITSPVCAKPESGWPQLETDYASSPSERDRAEVLQRAWAICCTCAHLDHCALLAVVDQHTGISAGDAYRNGRRLDERGRRRNP